MGLFDRQIARKPNMYPWTQEFIDKIWQGFWTPNEFDFRSDVHQFHTELTNEEREIIVRCLSAIGQVEIAVKTFWARLGDNLPHPSLSDLGYVMANTEVIHNQAYEKLLDALRLGDVFEANLQNPIIKGRVDYLRKYLDRVYEDDRKQYVYALILFTLFVENVSLFSQFYVVLWFNRFRNVLKDTAQQVQYTRNEETLHAQIGIKLINTLRQEYPELFDDDLTERVKDAAMVALSHEFRIIEWMVGDYDKYGLSAPVLKSFITNRIDDSLRSIGFKLSPAITIKQLEDTYWFDEALLGNNVTDFFTKKPVDYAKNNKTYNEKDLFG